MITFKGSPRVLVVNLEPNIYGQLNQQERKHTSRNWPPLIRGSIHPSLVGVCDCFSGDHPPRASGCWILRAFGNPRTVMTTRAIGRRKSNNMA